MTAMYAMKSRNQYGAGADVGAVCQTVTTGGRSRWDCERPDPHGGGGHVLPARHAWALHGDVEDADGEGGT